MHKGFRLSCQTLLSLTALALSAPSALASDSPSMPASSPRMIYVDRELAPDAVARGGGDQSKSPGASRRAAALNPLAEQLETGFAEYRDRWGGLPQLEIPAGPAMRAGAAGPRVRALRARLGLAEEGTFDTFPSSGARSREPQSTGLDGARHERRLRGVLGGLLAVR